MSCRYATLESDVSVCFSVCVCGPSASSAVPPQIHAEECGQAQGDGCVLRHPQLRAQWAVHVAATPTHTHPQATATRHDNALPLQSTGTQTSTRSFFIRTPL